MRQRDNPWELGEWIIASLGLVFYALVLVMALPMYAGFIAGLIDYVISGLTAG